MWTAVAEVVDMDNIHLRIFDADVRGHSALPRLLEWLPKSNIHELDDACRVYEWLLRNRHMVGKGSAVNLDKALRSNWRGYLNWLSMLTKRCAKSADTLIHPLTIAPASRLNQSTKSCARQAAARAQLAWSQASGGRKATFH